MNTYKTTVGLEIHAELKTNSKMFCGCANTPFASKPNENICPVCMAHPGTLPVINKQAVKNVLKVGLALGGEIADFTEFDRKNYFYPDIPKGYQISQYKYPLIKGGELAGVKITRIHLEEDTASSSHDTGDYSLVDFNRAGVPLMELVTEPVIHSPEEAGNFGRELQLLLKYLGVSDANMEKGEMRVEVNVSVSKTEKFGTKVEVKNLNSFRSAERAIAYEVARHTDLLERGEGDKIVQETRGWDDANQKTYSQRAKEDSHDYRYFPDPDLPKLKLSEIVEFKPENLKKELPELPWEKRTRYEKEFGIKVQDIEQYVVQKSLGAFFEAVILGVTDKKTITLASNYLSSDLVGFIKKDAGESDWASLISNLPFGPSEFKELIFLIEKGDLSSRGAKDVLAMMYKDGGKPLDIATKHDLIQKSDVEALTALAETIVKENPKVVADFKSGKEALFMFFIGQAMKATKGSANPEMLKEIFNKLLR